MDTSGQRLARGLGWFSVALGAPALVAPRGVARMIGLRPTRGTSRVVCGAGVQELVAAAGLLRQPRPVAWLWSRVAGDAAHLALLTAALRGRPRDRTRLWFAVATVAGATVVDTAAALRLAREAASPSGDGRLQARRTMTVRRPPDEVYGYWRDFSNFPTFMAHVRAVEGRKGTRSHWVAEAPAGTTVEWDAEIVEDVPGERIAWRSLPGSQIDNVGEVRFVTAPGDQGTEVHVDIRYEVPGGVAGLTLAKLFGEEPEQQLADDLRRCKQVLETGEVVRSDGSPEGTLARRLVKQRPANPGK